MQKTRKKCRIILLAVLSALILLFLGFSRFIGSRIFLSSTNLVTNEQTLAIIEEAWALENFDESSFRQAYTIETKAVTSSMEDAHLVPFDLITAQGNENWAIMVHGMMGSRWTNYPAARFFLENGYNVLTYDQRSSGENMAKGSAFGVWEKFDLIDCINYIKSQYPKAKLAVWGESFGGATALLALAHEKVEDNVDALILDCPVSSMKYMVQMSMEEMEIPLPMSYLLSCGDYVTRAKLGFGFDDADCSKAAEKISVPTLVFRTLADRTTPPFMGQEIYEHLASEQKLLYTAKDCGHVKIRVHEMDNYAAYLKDILP